jgi:hypothetical protein
MQKDAKRRTRNVVRTVVGEMSGGDVDEIFTALVTRMRAQGIEPNQSAVLKYAKSDQSRDPRRLTRMRACTHQE